jgi:hypothetical protein
VNGPGRIVAYPDRTAFFGDYFRIGGYLLATKSGDRESRSLPENNSLAARSNGARTGNAIFHRIKTRQLKFRSWKTLRKSNEAVGPT